MKCKQAQSIVAGLHGQEAPPSLMEHLARCRACAELYQFDDWMRNSLVKEVDPSPDALRKIRSAISQRTMVPNSTWASSLIGNHMSKILVSSLAAAGMAAILVVAPKLAYGSSAHSTFVKMRSAVLASAQHELQFNIKIGNNPTEPVQTWVIDNGNFVELQPGRTYQSDQGGSKVIIIPPGGSADLSNLPPDVQKAVKDAMKKTAVSGSGQTDGSGAHVTATVNGTPTDIKDVKKLLRNQGINFDIKIDLNEGDYQSITFGKDAHTLVLLPKKDSHARTVVQLDPKSNLPTCLTLQRQVNGKWVDQTF